MKRKGIVAFIAVLMILSVAGFTGCAAQPTAAPASAAPAVSAAAPTAAPTEAPAKKVTITICTRMSHDNPMGQAFYAMVDQFTKANPNVTIDDQSVVGNDDGPWLSKLQTAAATGEMFDVVENYGGALIKGYVDNGLFVDLQPYLNKDSAWKDSFLPVLDAWQFSSTKGQYGLPNGYFAVGWYYNKDIFAKYSLTPPATIEDFLKDAAVLQQNGIVPLALSAKTNWRFSHLLTSLSMKTYGFDETKGLADRTAKYTDDNFVSLLSTIKDWQGKGIFGDNIMSFDYDAECAMFYSGKSAIHEDGSWFISTLIKGAPDLVKNQSIGFIPFPYYADKPQYKGSMMGGPDGGLSVGNSKDPAKVAAAVSLVKYLTTASVKQGVFESFNGAQLPPFKGLTIDATKVDYLTALYISVLGQSATDMRTEINTYDSLPSLQDVTRNALQGMMSGNSAADTAKAIQDEIDKNK